MGKCDIWLLGGKMIFTFYKAQGLSVGSSLVEEDHLDLATTLLAKAKEKGVSLLLLTDVVVANKFAPDAYKIMPAYAIPDGLDHILSRHSMMPWRPPKLSLDPMRNESKCALAYGQMNEPPGAHARVGLTGLTVAEYFRDAEGQDVLLFIDNIFCFTQANSKVSALLGRIPSAVGSQPTLPTDLGCLQERITTTKKGSITSVQAIYIPADDLTDPGPATIFARLDVTTVLSKQISELGIYLVVDPLDSTSRMLLPHILGEDHYNTACGVQKVLQNYKNL